MWVEFEWDTDIYLARRLSVRIVLYRRAVRECGKPTMGPQSSILGELLIIGLTSDTTSMLDLPYTGRLDYPSAPALYGRCAQVAVLGR